MTDFFVRLASWPIAGPTIAFMAILAQWEKNQLRLAFEGVWPTLLIATALALLITAIFRIFVRSWSKAGIAAGLVAFYLFYAPALVGLARLPYSAAALLNLAAIGALALLWLRLPTEARPFASIAGRINLLCLFLLAATAFPVIAKQLELEPQRSQALAALGEFDGEAGLDSPDVWHIVFDRYAATGTLRSHYGYNNGPFVDALKKRGFTVVEPAFSNYQRTSHSVASTLNGTLLDPMSAPMVGQQRDWVPIYRAMQDNAAIRAFNRMGYRTVFAGSWWEPTRTSFTASQTILIRSMPQLARSVLDQSSAGFWLRGHEVPWLDGRTDQCFRANEKFQRLRELADAPDRKQVFAHFLVPHPPFVLNEDGSCRTLEQAHSAGRTENYLAALRFANREALQLIDAILAGPRPAVIVIHSDEGPWPQPYVGNEHGLGTDPVPVRWAHLTPEQLREKMGILLAIRDPSGNPPRSVPASPVQIYPVILKDHFGSKQPLPPSKHAVFASDVELYRFVDVEAKLAER